MAYCIKNRSHLGVLVFLLSGFGFGVATSSAQSNPPESFSSDQKAEFYLKIARKPGLTPDSLLVLSRLAVSHTNEGTLPYATANYLAGEALFDLSRLDSSIFYFKKALPLFESFDSLGRSGVICLRLGYLYAQTGNFAEALSYLFSGESKFLMLGDKLNLAKINHHIGMIYNDMDEPEKALSKYRQALELYKVLDDSESAAAVYQNMGVCYAQLGQFEQALSMYQESLAVYQEINNPYGIAVTNNNIGGLQSRQGNHKEAAIYFRKAYEFFIQGAFQREATLSLTELANELRSTGRKDEALVLYQQGVGTAEKYNFKTSLIELYQNISEIYEEMYDYKNALVYYKLYNQTYSEVYQGEQSVQFKELERKHNLELKEKELLQKNTDLRLQKTQKTALLIVLTLIFGLLLFVVRIYRRTEAERLTLEEQRKGLESLVETRTAELRTEISERRIAEESDKLKSAFLANMSHEIRTPMNAIISFSNFLKEKGLSEEKKLEYIGYIASSGKSLLRLIDDIIDSAKIEANQLVIKKSPCNINKLLQEIHTLFIETRPNLPGTIQFNYVDPMPDRNIIIQTDQVRLRQVLTNLIDNAYKYTEKGSISFGYENMPTSALKFFVRDTGVGIPADKELQVFNRFTRVNIQNDKIHSGTGLGLSISKELVSLLGGKIWFESTVHVGTTFYFTVPYNQIEVISPDTQRIGSQIGRSNDLAYNWEDKHILIAEDDDLNFKILETIIRKTNARITRAEDGRKAVDCIRTQAVDLVLMDIQMPEMDGYEATRMVKKINSRLPVIAQTSFAMRDEREKCLEAGCDDYLSKPINLKELMEKISKFLS